MRAVAERCLEALKLLIRSTQHAGPDDLPGLVTRAGEIVGARRAVVYLADYDQVVLVPLSDGHEAEQTSEVPVDGTLPGRVFQSNEPQVSSDGDEMSVWLPLVNGTERLGVMYFVFDADAHDDDVPTVCEDLTRVAAQLVATRALYGDRIEQTRRRTRLSVPAEMQWRQLPPLTFMTGSVTITGVLLPTDDISGDSFDYAVNGNIAYVAIIDAMGHQLQATLLSSVAVGALRNSRRRGLGIADIVRTIDAEVGRQFGVEMFVTAIVGALDIGTGHWSWITCGHPPALVVRQGRVVKTLDQSNGMPLGLGMLPPDLDIGEEQLEPGDRVLLYTDGVVEARDAAGQFFGTERLVEFVGREAAAGLPPPETLRRLNMAILGHQEGLLQDDATTVLLEWRGVPVGAPAMPPG